MIFNEDDILNQTEETLVKGWMRENCRLSPSYYKLNVEVKDGETYVDLLKADGDIVKRNIIIKFENRPFILRRCDFEIDLGFNSIKYSPYICPEMVDICVRTDKLDEFEDDLKTIRPTYISRLFITFYKDIMYNWTEEDKNEFKKKFSIDVLKSYMIFTDEIKYGFI